MRNAAAAVAAAVVLGAVVLATLLGGGGDDRSAANGAEDAAAAGAGWAARASRFAHAGALVCELATGSAVAFLQARGSSRTINRISSARDSVSRLATQSRPAPSHGRRLPAAALPAFELERAKQAGAATQPERRGALVVQPAGAVDPRAPDARARLADRISALATAAFPRTTALLRWHRQHATTPARTCDPAGRRPTCAARGSTPAPWWCWCSVLAAGRALWTPQRRVSAVLVSRLQGVEGPRPCAPMRHSKG
jgi:hypothetical protein